jgi:hypothetical protein
VWELGALATEHVPLHSEDERARERENTVPPASSDQAVETHKHSGAGESVKPLSCASPFLPPSCVPAAAAAAALLCSGRRSGNGSNRPQVGRRRRKLPQLNAAHGHTALTVHGGTAAHSRAAHAQPANTTSLRPSLSFPQIRRFKVARSTFIPPSVAEVETASLSTTAGSRCCAKERDHLAVRMSGPLPAAGARAPLSSAI